MGSRDSIADLTALRSPRELLRHPLHFLSFGFGSGLAAKAPGTAGTLVAVPLYLLLAPLALSHYLLVAAALFGVGIWLCESTSRALGVHDHPAIVWDEVVGYLLTMAAAPEGWAWPLVGLVLFRLFDILKPQPIGWVDRRISGGLGIMFDDALAALYAWLVLQLLAAAF